MKRALTIVAAIALIAAVAFFVALNRTSAEFFYAPEKSLEAPLGGLVVAAFLAGVVVAFAAAAVVSTRHALTLWRQRRQHRRREQFDLWQQRAGALMWEGDSKQARALFEKATRRDPRNAAAVVALAASYQVTGEDRRALQLLSDSVKRHHSANPDVLFALEQVQANLGERAARLETLERLRALHPRAPRVLRDLRDAYIAAGRWSEAISAQEGIVAEIRDSERTAREQEKLLALRYQAALAVEDPRGRATALAALAERRTTPTPVAISLGDAFVDARDHEQAWSTWERALRTAPRTVIVERLTPLATDPRRQDRLSSLLGRLRQDDANLEHVKLLSAQAHLQAGRVAEAARDLEAIDPTHASSVLYFALRGETFQRRGQVDQALDAYARCLEAKPLEHRCRDCGRASDAWVGFCVSCGAWDSYRSTVEISRG